MFHVKHLLPSVSGCAACRMQAARTGSSATGPSATIEGTATTPSCRMPGGMFHVKRTQTAPTPETPGSQPSPARMAPPLEICRPCPATRSIPGIQAAPHPRTLQLSDRTTHPELAECMFHVKHLLPSISECAASQMQTARTEPLATNPFAAISGTTTAPSCRMPGRMFHVKHSRTTPDGHTHLKRSGSRLHLANRSAGNAISV